VIGPIQFSDALLAPPHCPTRAGLSLSTTARQLPGIILYGSVLTAQLAILAIQFRVHLWNKRFRSGQCPHCGYDLRATPDHCPECGQTADNDSTKRSTLWLNEQLTQTLARQQP
jgi:tRNA(Ile2) C34 agmatinyltransferase TiaS